MSIYPIYTSAKRMDLPWRYTKSGRVAVSCDGEEFYHNPKTGWVPIPRARAKRKDK